MAAKKGVVRHGHSKTASGAVKVTTTKKPRGIVNKLIDKALKSQGR